MYAGLYSSVAGLVLVKIVLVGLRWMDDCMNR